MFKTLPEVSINAFFNEITREESEACAIVNLEEPVPSAEHAIDEYVAVAASGMAKNMLTVAGNWIKREGLVYRYIELSLSWAGAIRVHCPETEESLIEKPISETHMESYFKDKLVSEIIRELDELLATKHEGTSTSFIAKWSIKVMR